MLNNSMTNGIIRQKNNVDELNAKIKECDKVIERAEKTKKKYKRLAIILPIVITVGTLGGGAILNSLMGPDAISYVTLLQAAKLPLILPVALGCGFPIYYGLKYYGVKEYCQNKKAERKDLTDAQTLSVSLLQSLEKGQEDSRISSINETEVRGEILSKFFNCEKKRLIGLYNIGHLSDLEGLGWSVNDIVYLQELIEDEINPKDTLGKEQVRVRVQNQRHDKN